MYKIFWWNGEKTFLKLSTFTDTAAIEKIDVDYDKTLLKLFNGNIDTFVFAKSDVDAEDMSIFVHLAPKDRNTMEVITFFSESAKGQLNLGTKFWCLKFSKNATKYC